MNLGCVLLAAGAGRRFGGDKLRFAIEGESMFLRALRLYSSVPFLAGVCVLRPDAGDMSTIAKDHGFLIAVNPAPERGIGSSVAIATQALMEHALTLDGVLYGVCDQPWLSRESILRLIEAFSNDPARIASLSFDGQRGNPAIFPADLLNELAMLSGDQGGGSIIRRFSKRLMLVDAANAKELHDIDSQADVGGDSLDRTAAEHKNT